MKKIVIFLLAVTFFLSSCSLDGSIEILMKPPTLSEEQGEIYAALNQNLGSEFEFCYPSEGANLSPIIIANIDEEPSEEAIAFYKKTDKSGAFTGVRFNILDKTDSGWFSVYDHSGVGTGIERVSLSTIGSDNFLKFIVGYDTRKSENIFNVYKFRDGKLTTEYTDKYTAFFTNDIDNDDENELFAISIHDKSNNTQSNIRLIEENEGKTQLASSVLLSENSTEVLNIITGNVEENIPAIFIDSTDGENYYTEIIYTVDGVLRNPLYLSESKQIEYTKRSAGYFSNDIDNDGIIEIPTLEYVAGYNEASLEPIYLVNWNEYESFSLDVKWRSYYNLADGYCFIMPNRWEDVVTVKIDSTNGDIVFYKYDLQVEDSSLELFRIGSVYEEFVESRLSDGYELIARNENHNYVVKNTEHSEESLCLTKTEIINNFYIIK